MVHVDGQVAAHVTLDPMDVPIPETLRMIEAHDPALAVRAVVIRSGLNRTAQVVELVEASTGCTVDQVPAEAIAQGYLAMAALASATVPQPGRAA